MTRGETAGNRINTAVRTLLAAALAAAALAATTATAQAAVFWGNYDNGRIGRADNTGASAMPSFIGAPVGPFGVAAAESRLYWADYDTGAIGRADVSGATPAGVDAAFVTGVDGVFAVAADKDHIYWGTVGGTIGRAAIAADGSLGAVESSLVTGAGYIEGLAVADDAIYWTDFDMGRIGRAALASDGSVSSVEPNLLTVNGAAGIAVAGNRLYWANSFGNSIGRAQIEGDGSLSGIDQTFITGAQDPAGVAVAGTEVFWTNASSSRPPMGSLSRARLAADGSLAAVQHELIFDDAGVFGVAIGGAADTEPPVITMTPLAPPSGAWFSSADSPGGVTVDVAASDPSGVTSLSCSADGATVLADTGGAPGTFTLQDGVYNVVCTAGDGSSPSNVGAGPGSPAFPVTLPVDLTAPSISCLAGPSDWVAFNVFFTCSASDGGSGLANGADATFYLSTSVADGSGDPQAMTGTYDVGDLAGNTATAAALKAKVDLAGPVITCPAPPVLDLGGAATPVVATVTDAHSGPASPTATGVTSTDVEGDRTTTVTAYDKLGNRGSADCAYTVKAPAATSKYVFRGLRNLHKWSFRHGSRIPLRFRLTDADGRPVSKAVARLTVVKAEAGAEAASLLGRRTARRAARRASRDVFRPLGRGRYLYVLNTRRLPGPGKYEVRVSLDDGSVHSAPLRLRSRRSGGHRKSDD